MLQPFMRTAISKVSVLGCHWIQGVCSAHILEYLHHSETPSSPSVFTPRPSTCLSFLEDCLQFIGALVVRMHMEPTMPGNLNAHSCGAWPWSNDWGVQRGELKCRLPCLRSRQLWGLTHTPELLVRSGEAAVGFTHLLSSLAFPVSLQISPGSTSVRNRLPTNCHLGGCFWGRT